MSNIIGLQPDLVQGGGGNTSVKLDSENMYIKASGVMLRDMTEALGYVQIPYKNVCTLFEQKISVSDEMEQEIISTNFINSLSSIHGVYPSMETAMHVFLGRYVVHTHPVYLNVLLCAPSGKLILQSFDQLANIIPYTSPGYHLGCAIQKVSTSMRSSTIFLENHGLIVSAESSQEAIDMTFCLNDMAKKYLYQIKVISQDFQLPELECIDAKLGLYKAHTIYQGDVSNLFHLLMSEPLIPDFVVYCLKNIKNVTTYEQMISDIEISTYPCIYLIENGDIYFKGKVARVYAMTEVFFAELYILQALHKIGDLRCLSKEDVAYLEEMESEKYRKQILG